MYSYVDVGICLIPIILWTKTRIPEAVLQTRVHSVDGNVGLFAGILLNETHERNGSFAALVRQYFQTLPTLSVGFLQFDF